MPSAKARKFVLLFHFVSQQKAILSHEIQAAEWLFTIGEFIIKGASEVCRLKQVSFLSNKTWDQGKSA